MARVDCFRLFHTAEPWPSSRDERAERLKGSLPTYFPADDTNDVNPADVTDDDASDDDDEVEKPAKKTKPNKSS